MIFLGYPNGIKGYLFMRLPNNILFKGTTAVFDEEMMPKCTKTVKRRFTPLGKKLPSKEDPPIPLEPDDDDDFPPHRRSPLPDQWDDALDRDDGPPRHSPLHTPLRQQVRLPPAERQPPPPPQKSGRERKIPVRPDNVYGDKRNPVNLEQEDRRCCKGTVGSEASDLLEPAVRQKSLSLQSN